MNTHPGPASMSVPYPVYMYKSPQRSANVNGLPCPAVMLTGMDDPAGAHCGTGTTEACARLLGCLRGHAGHYLIVYSHAEHGQHLGGAPGQVQQPSAITSRVVD